MKAYAKILMSLITVLALSACGSTTGTTLAGGDALMIDGVATETNRAVVVTEAKTLQLSSSVGTTETIKRITIYIKQGTGDYIQRESCTVTPCEYSWVITSTDNGTYSFLVEFEDQDNNSSAAVFKNVLAVNIQ